MDYGRPVAFGFFPEPAADDAAGVLDQVLAAERGPGPGRHPGPLYQRTHLDAWSLLTWLGARTSTVTLFPDVANLPLRTPAMLAKAAARPVEQWITEPSELVLDHGMDTFVLWAGEPRQQQVAVFAHEVAPVVRARVAHGRGS